MIASAKRQASDRHPHRRTDRQAGRAMRLQRRERDPGGAHRRDHRRLQPEASLDEPIPDGRRQRGGEDDERQRDPEPAALPRGLRVSVECPDDDDRDHGQAERPQCVPLTPQPQRSAGLRPCDARALAAGGYRRPHDARGLFGHGHLLQTIERRPARGERAGRAEESFRGDHAAAGIAIVPGACEAVSRRARSWTVTSRALTSISAIETSATGHAAAPM